MTFYISNNYKNNMRTISEPFATRYWKKLKVHEKKFFGPLPNFLNYNKIAFFIYFWNQRVKRFHIMYNLTCLIFLSENNYFGYFEKYKSPKNFKIFEFFQIFFNTLIKSAKLFHLIYILYGFPEEKPTW